MQKRDNTLFKLFILTAVSVFSFYRADPAVATAAEPNMESVVEPETEEVSAPDAGSVTEESIPQDTEPQLAAMLVLEPAVEEAPAPDIEPVMEESEQPEVETEQSVSTGSELTAWLESHKNTGGTVKLSDNVVLDEDYCFCPDGINMPDVFVNTGKYTVTVAGEIELLSDNHLIFSGQPEGKGIFYIAPQGMLAMEGITVKSEQGAALWQEEGAGLMTDSCSVSGDIHYADMPFVMYFNPSICAVAEKGQTVNDVLPPQISCTVNREGKQFSNEPVSVSWNLEGTEKQQEERRRFKLQGSFVNAASNGAVFCTVAYNDYPLTFTDVQASTNGFSYIFQGGFTAPEESLPFTVMSEYSFDGENWLLFEEQTASNTDAGFYIACICEQRSMAAESNVYIRLQWNDNGTRYFSNVLCYSADNLEIVEDIGGSRGGGTSIVNPPDEPEPPTEDDKNQNTGSDAPSGNPGSDAPSENPGSDAPSGNTGSDASSENPGGDAPPENAGSGVSSGQTGSKKHHSGTKKTENEGGDSGQTEVPQAEYAGVSAEQLPNVNFPSTDVEPLPQAEIPNVEEKHVDKDQPSGTGHSSISETQALYAESNAGDIAGINRGDAGISEKSQERSAAGAINEGGSEMLSIAGEQALHADNRQGSPIIVAAGLVLLSAAGGMAGFYIHSRSGTNR